MNCGVKQECAIVNHSYTIANRSKCTYSLATCVIAACFAAKKQEKKPKQNPTPNATNAPSLHEKKKKQNLSCVISRSGYLKAPNPQKKPQKHRCLTQTEALELPPLQRDAAASPCPPNRRLESHQAQKSAPCIPCPQNAQRSPTSPRSEAGRSAPSSTGLGNGASSNPSTSLATSRGPGSLGRSRLA